MIRILHVTSSYWPHVGGSSVRLSNLLKPLVDGYDFEMHVLAPRYDNHGTMFYNEPVADYECIEGVHVHRVNRLLDIPLRAWILTRQLKIDIIQAHNMEMGILSRHASLGRPFLLDIHTLRPMSSSKRLTFKFLLRSSTHIVVLAKSARSYLLKEFSIPEHRVSVVYNGVDLNRFHASCPKDEQLRQHLCLRNNLIVGYLGTFYDWQGVNEFLACAREISKRRNDVQFLMVGNGPEWESIRDQISSGCLNHQVLLTGSVPPEQVPLFMNLMDIFVVPRLGSLETDTAVPLKLLEAMAMGKPVLATNLHAQFPFHPHKGEVQA